MSSWACTARAPRCIPQECACSTAEEKEQQQNQLRDAIRSLHTYVAHSGPPASTSIHVTPRLGSFFLILAPAQHHEKGRLMDYTSWKSRGRGASASTSEGLEALPGWCQFELTVNVLMGARLGSLMRL